MRPAMKLGRNIWEFFCLKYPLMEHRNKIIEDLLLKQLENEIVDVPKISFKSL